MRLYTANSLQHLRTRTAAQITPLIPAKLYLDLTQDCNMFCVMCRDTPGRRGRIMDMDLFRRVVDETCSGVTSYSLFNWGESLLLEDFWERIEYIVERKRPEALIDLATNGMLLTEETSKRLLDYNVEVTVSFDAATAESFEAIRRGARFDTVCANLKKAAELGKDVEPYHAPGIYVAIQKNNWTELPDIINLVNSLGVRRVGMGPVVGPKEFKLEPTAQVVSVIGESINMAESLGMVVDLYPTRLGGYIRDGNKYTDVNQFYVETNCDAPFTTASVAWNGEVFLCCNVGEMVESIQDKGFREVWMGERYQKLRESVNKRGAMPAMCTRCPWVNRY